MPPRFPINVPRAGVANSSPKGETRDWRAANLAASCKINGTGAGETINGNSKRNCIYAKGGNDKVNAKGGNDKVVGGPGLDTLNGGTGNDYFDALDGQHDVVEGGSGANQGLFDGIDTGPNVPGL